ncbi:MAG: DUF1294 domain-containing protein [Ruminococcaceae bacterium]|nr:DUF1294 domain-containing protein [Oscillospiraceae bacterium]
MNTPLKILLIYLGIISLISIIVCIYDKTFSKLNKVKFRVPEKSLFIFSALGGSVAMFLCMLLIRHKTKHVSFMVGIPLIILVHAALIFAGFHFGIFAF